MRERGFRVNEDISHHDDVDSVVERCLWWEERRESLDFEIDGVVVRGRPALAVARAAASRAASRARASPGHFSADHGDDDAQQDRLERRPHGGRLLPFAMLEPVHVGGVTVSTATLHNEEDLAKKDVRERDEVIVTRAGDVIPQVIAPLIQRREGKRLRKARPPKECPMCGTPTVKPDGLGVDDLPQPARLPGPELPARQALPRRHGHRGARREERHALPRRGADHRPGVDHRL